MALRFTCRRLAALCAAFLLALPMAGAERIVLDSSPESMRKGAYTEAGSGRFRETAYRSMAPGENGDAPARWYQGPEDASFTFRAKAGEARKGRYFLHYTTGNHPFSTRFDRRRLYAPGHDQTIPAQYETAVGGKTVDRGVIYFDLPLAFDTWLLVSGKPVEVSENEEFTFRVTPLERNPAKEWTLLLADAIMLDTGPQGIVPPNAVREFVLSSPDLARKRAKSIAKMLKDAPLAGAEQYFAAMMSWADLNLCASLTLDSPDDTRKAALESAGVYQGWNEVFGADKKEGFSLINGGGYDVQMGLFSGPEKAANILQNRLSACRVVSNPNLMPDAFEKGPASKHSRGDEIAGTVGRCLRGSPELLNAILFSPSVDGAMAAHFPESRKTGAAGTLEEAVEAGASGADRERMLYVCLQSRMTRHWAEQALAYRTAKPAAWEKAFADPFLRLQEARLLLLTGQKDECLSALKALAAAEDATLKAFASQALRQAEAYFEGSSKCEDVFDIYRPTTQTLRARDDANALAFDLLQASMARAQEQDFFTSACVGPAPVVSLKPEALKGMKFQDIEAKIKDAGAPVFGVGQIFAESAGVERDGCSGAALQYLAQNSDSVVACRLFQDLAGDVILFSDASHAQGLAKIVREKPDSLLAGAICTEYGLERVYWPGIAKGDAFASGVADVAPLSLAGLLTSPRAEISGAMRHQRLAHLIRMWQTAEKRFPKLRQAVPESAALSDARVFYRKANQCRWAAEQALLWNRLGAESKAAASLADARTIWQSFRPAGPSSLFPPEQLAEFLRSVSAACASRGPSLEDLASMPAAARAEHIEKRMKAYGRLIQLACAETTAPLLDRKTAQAGKAEALQAFLDDLLVLMTNTGDAETLSEYARLLRQELISYFSAEEMSRALQWVESKAGEKVLASARPEFDRCVAEVSLYKGDMTNCVARLERIAKSYPGSEDARVALARLANLYLKYWNAPDKAVEAERRLAAMFPGARGQWDAMLRIARVYYDQKKYEESIYELEKTLREMPAGSRTEPLRMVLGLSYLASADYEEARNQLAQVVNADTGSLREKGLYLIGYSYICEQKYADAAKPFRDLVGMYPNSEYRGKAETFLTKITTGQSAK